MSRSKPIKRLTAKQLQEDVDFYHALAAMPPDQRARLAPDFDAITEAHEAVLAAEVAERAALEALAAAREAVHAAHLAVCEARIADLCGEPPVTAADDTADDDGSPPVH